MAEPAPATQPSLSDTTPLLGGGGGGGGDTSNNNSGPLRPTEIPQRSDSHRNNNNNNNGHNANGRNNNKRTSAGVARAATISSHLTTTHRTLLFLSIFLVGYAYGLESQVRSAYQPYATASFHLHSYLSTINVLRSVVAVAVQPTAARIADVFGRFEMVAVSTLLYTVGIIIEATASGVVSFCVGAVVYQIGYTCIVLLMEVLIADFSSMRARVFFSYIPALPFLINTWISGDVTSAVLEGTDSWRWGIGMWALIYPVASLPLLVALYVTERRALRLQLEEAERERLMSSGGEDDDDEGPKEKRTTRQVVETIFHQLDVVGLITVVFSLSLILAPLTITKTAEQWRSPSTLVPFFIGILLFPTFVVWEQRGARNPLIPFHLLTDRGVWAALVVRSLLNFAWYTQGNYLYTVLVVFDFSIESATRILSFFSFFGVLSGLAIGVVIFKVRRLKLIIVIGTILFTGAFALLIGLPGGVDPTSRGGLVASQILMGLASGLFAYPTQASIQASATREHVAILTGLYLSFYNVGSAFGTSLSGGMWTGTLLSTLTEKLSFLSPGDGGIGGKELAKAIYDDPFDILPHYPVGTEIRGAIVESYSYMQRLLGIAGIALCVPMMLFAFALRNPKLSDGEVQADAELLEGEEEHGEAVGEQGSSSYRD